MRKTSVRKRPQRRDNRAVWQRILGHPYSDEAAHVIALAGGAAAGHQLLAYLPKDVKSSYIKNITKLSRRKMRVPAKQLAFNLEGGKRPAKFRSVALIDKTTASKLKSRINYNFREGKGGKFRFFGDTKQVFRGIARPYFSKKGKNIHLPTETWKQLRAANRKSLKKVLPGRFGRIALFGSALLLPSLTKTFQQKYSRKRKFKKEVKRSVRRGVINPVKGAFYGKTLDQILRKYPSLRGSRSIRQAEGRYAQLYGQGVQFYRGTSGMRKEDIDKLNSALAERRRISKRRRGK